MACDYIDDDEDFTVLDVLRRSIQLSAQSKIDAQIIERLTEERDVLARRCAEQARELVALKCPPPVPAEPHPILTAIAVHQSQGVR